MSDIIREVDEELRRERLANIWKKYRGLIVLAVFLIVAGTAGWRGYEYYSQKQAEAASERYASAQKLAADPKDGGEQVPDRDLVLALPPEKVEALQERFARIGRNITGNGSKKPRFNAVLSVTAEHISAAQRRIQPVLDKAVKRWTLDEVVTHSGKPSELYYLVRLKKSATREDVLTAVRQAAGESIEAADLELGAELAGNEGG